MQTPLLFFFVFVSFFLLNIYPIFTTAKDIFLNCGSSSNSIGLDGHHWTGDSGNTPFGGSGLLNGSSVVLNSLPPSIDPIPFMTARIFQSPFTYSFRVSPGQNFIRLHFYPGNYHQFQRSKAFFTVTAGPFTLLSNFSPSYTVDSLRLQTLVKEFCLNIEENHQVLNITFSPSSAPLGAYAFINGIEIVSMPTNLYFTGSNDRRIHGSALRNRFPVENSTALEMIHRLNIGGGSISPENDSGSLYREWSDDKDYFRGSGDGLVNASSIRIKYLKVAPYVAPAKVYQTSRSAIKSKSLAWNLTVDSGFIYLLRLHLCDNREEATKRGRRKFLIRIGDGKGKNIEEDVISWSGGRGIPVYRDYVVKVQNEGSFGKTDLVISLGNLKDLNSNPILNGLEVFKLNDSQGNLAGLNPALKTAPIPSPGDRSEVLEFTIGGAAVILILLSGLAIIFCLLRRGKCNTKDNSIGPKGLCRRFTLEELRAATNNFDRALIIGNGGFGRVYKGYIDGGDTPVAIKALKPTSTQGSNEFEAEIKMLSDLRHLHLQSLAEWVQQRIKAGKLNRIIDPNLKGEIAPECLKVFASIALKCLNCDKHKRPIISSVLKRLERALELQNHCTDSVSDGESLSSNDMEIVSRSCNNNSKAVHSCPTFWNKTVSHKELFRFLSDKAGFKWSKRPPALSLCGLQALYCSVPAYGALSRDGHMSNSSDYGTPGRVMVPILFDDDDTFKL
ncbi:hypothetical protein COLO4_37981 [Corchorus olitorius]|uniref:Protein kinase domain-containing protein n=1 Tax=Corchorus olitorius TaxID=93759 RepID=A0A1R3FXR5_9ROSI|nr:hypothetical protein COLO4_37981 [Corchorus olitorius]